MKKLVSIVLLLVMLIGVVSCGEKVEPPTGFQLASVESAPFYLYVPNTWTSNASSGISSAYYSSSGNRILVSAFAQKDEGDTSLQLYTAKTLESFQRTLDKFELASELEETTLGSYAAYCFEYKATSDNKAMRFCTYVSEYAEGFAVLTYSAEQEVFENFEEDFENIVAKFSFKVENSEEVETKKPQQQQDQIDGWQLASSSAYEFDFFVPKSWTVDKASEIPTATCSAGTGDRSNVTMMSYVLSEPTTAKAYWDRAKEELVYEYEVIATDENVKLGGLSAFAVEYRTGLGDMMYHVKQVFCATSNMIYVFTYTSDDTYYESHLNAVDAMLTMFAFN